MSHGEAHEEAEHAEHHSHDPFTKLVALSMVVIAAVLAGVKVLGHRAHNDTLDYRIQAGDKRTQAGDMRTQADTLHTKSNVERTMAASASVNASNQWAYFQAKKLRQHYYEVSSELLKASAKDGAGTEKADEWKKSAAKYAQECDEIMSKAKFHEGEEKAAKAKAEHHEKEANEKTHEADKVAEEALELEHKSVHAHHKGDRYDLGEMGVELGLVVCSVAILVRRTAFWYGGMALGGVGALITLMGLMS
jgi:hypothetical protein